MPLSYSAAGQLSRCGKLPVGSVTLRKSPVAMNDESIPWFWALSAPLRSRLRPDSGSSIPEIGNGSPVSGSKPPPGVVTAAPKKYSIGSPCESPEPRQRQASRRDRRCRAALQVLERVVELRAEPCRVLLPGALTRVEDAPALVHEVAHLEHLLHREPGRVAGTPPGLARDDVVAGVPEDGVVVAEHAEVVGRRAAVAVDVVDVERDAVGVKRVGVEVEVLRRGDARLRRRRAGVVLGREDQHAPAGV